MKSCDMCNLEIKTDEYLGFEGEFFDSVHGEIQICENCLPLFTNWFEKLVKNIKK